MRRSVLIALLCLLPAFAGAQSVPNAGPNDSFGWNQAAPTLVAAQGYAYKYYLDGATTGSVFSGVTCSGTTSPFTCQVRIPNFAMGQHSITFTAASVSGESAQSVPFAFVYGDPPTSPNNMRIIKGTTP